MAGPQSDSANEDSLEQCAPAPFMLSPQAPETTILLLGITFGTTAFLHSISITHIVGILYVVLAAKAINASCTTINIFARVSCIRDRSETCPQFMQAKVEDFGREVLAWISGVAAQERVLEGPLYTEAGQDFIRRAGLIGAIAIFGLVYFIASVIYSTAYRRVLAAVSIAEADTVPAKNGPTTPKKQSIKNTNNNSGDCSTHSNPLVSQSDDVLSNFRSTGAPKWESILPVVRNPLQEPEDDHSACCTACEALEAAHTEWIATVRQYDEANDAALEGNDSLKLQVHMLQAQVSNLREYARRQNDRSEYLDVLVEEAGKQLGLGKDT